MKISLNLDVFYFEMFNITTVNQHLINLNSINLTY
jgi:hypothetical protein